MDWPGAAKRLQQSAQQPQRRLTASRSQEGALQKGRSHPKGRAPLRSRERDPHFLPLLLPPLSPRPLPVSLPLPPPGSECPCAPRARAAARAAFPAPSPSPHSPPPPRRARRSRRRGRWRRPPAPAGPRGRFEEPETHRGFAGRRGGGG